MKSFDTELKKYTEKVRLKTAERRELRERILSYMEYHPLPKQEDSLVKKLGEIRHESYISIPLHMRSWYMRMAGGVCAIFVFVIVPFIAERAVPGDVLYLVKVGVTEGIQGTLANSPYEKIAFETKLIERRLAEARLLASEGKLTSDVEAQIIETVQTHADAVQNGLAELRATDADGAAIAEIVVNSALEVQTAVLAVNESTETDSSTGNLLAMVNTMREEVSANPESTVPSFEGLAARIEKETTRGYELFEAIKSSATIEEITDVERRIADIGRKVIAAKELHTTDETGAITELMDALGLNQKLITFMTDIDVRETVALETLVPVIPTIEERTAILSSKHRELENQSILIKEALVGEVSVDILGKAQEGTTQLDTLLADALVARDAGMMDDAEQKIQEAQAFAQDLFAILGINTNTIVVPPPTELATSTDPVATSTESVATSTMEQGEGIDTPAVKETEDVE